MKKENFKRDSQRKFIEDRIPPKDPEKESDETIEEELRFAEAYLRSLKKPKPIIKKKKKMVPYFAPRHEPEVIEIIEEVPVRVERPQEPQAPGNSGSLDQKVNPQYSSEAAPSAASVPSEVQAPPGRNGSDCAPVAPAPVQQKELPDLPELSAEPKEAPPAPLVRTRKHVRPNGNLFVPTTRDLINYFEKEEVLDGDILQLKKVEDQALLITLAYIQNIPFGIEGYAGSAKTKLMDKLLKIVDHEKFYVLTSASDKALYYDRDEINSQEWMYVTEMQKCMNLVEIFKTLAEGKPATHRVKIGKDTVKIELDPKPICFTRAYDNRWDLDKELRRRFMIMDTTLTPEENEEIVKTMLSNTHKIIKYSKKDEDLADSISVHLDKLRQKEDLLFFDPYGDCLAEVIPAQDKRLRAYIKHYHQILRASAKYHLNDRMQFKQGKYTYVVLELADHFNIFRSYHQDFINVLKQFDERNEGEFDKYDGVQIDWQKWAKEGYEVMKDHSDAEVIRKALPNFVDKWHGKQTKDGAFWVLDYKTGDDIKIADAPILEI